MEIKVINNADTLREVGVFLVPKSQKILSYTFMCLSLVVGIIFGVTSHYAIMVGLFIASAVFALELRLLKRNYLRAQINRTKEMCGGAIPNMECVLRLDENEIYQHNTYTNAEYHFQYGDITGMKETANLYAIFTRSNILITISKVGVAGREEEFKQILKAKCVNAKI